MKKKVIVNDLVEVGFESVSEVLNFAGFTKKSEKNSKCFDEAEEIIRGLSIDDTIKKNLLQKVFDIEDSVFDRLGDCSEEYFRAGICFVLNFIFDAKNFTKKIELELQKKRSGE